ncbi:MAG: GPI anchored serine-threonine rich family protein [Vicinamibacterales bacterium]|nr:GPI anchored serine-threonine rich family protein [Vicinamibacterales bacterium]
MKKYSLAAPALFVCAFLCTSVDLLAQTVTLGGSASVASAEDFAARTFQDPWDMNERTDFGWFLNGSDNPLPELSNVSFASGIFSATTAVSPNVFLLETGNPYAARLGKTGANYPIDADFYRFLAIRVNMSGPSQSVLTWNRDNLWDLTDSSSNIINLTAGWRTYLVDLQALGKQTGPISWGGLIRSLRFHPSYNTTLNIQIDWIRLVNIDTNLCRKATWTGFSGAIDLYLDTDTTTNGNETVLAKNISSAANGNSAGCLVSGSGAGYNFYAGALAPGSYQVLARAAGTSGAFTRPGTAYLVNATPTMSFTLPSDEGSADDFATAQLGNAWDMNALSDVDDYFGLCLPPSCAPPSITPIVAETPAGTSLGSVSVFSAISAPAQPGLVGDPILQPLSSRGDATRIDPLRYRILTVEFGIPNAARNVNNGSIARIAWRAAGGINYTVTDDIIFNSRLGVSVLDKVSLDMSDRAVLPIEASSPSQLGWVPGGMGGIDRFRFDPHEYSGAVTFFLKRIKLAALERLNSGGTYTFQWTASESNGTVNLYYDTDRNPTSGTTPIGSAPTSAGSFVWNNIPVVPLGEYYIYAVITDGQNGNGTYARWPVLIGQQPPIAPPNVRIVH